MCASGNAVQLEPLPGKVHFTINPRRLALWLGLPAVFFLLVHPVVLALQNVWGIHSRWIRVLIIDREQSLPSLYGLIQFMTCVALLAVMVQRSRGDRAQFLFWLGILVAFSFATMDDFLSLHERWTLALRKANRCVPYSAWCVPWGLGVAVLVPLYLRFIFRLPRATRSGFVLACLSFLSGALVAETVSGLHARRFGKDDLYCYLMVPIKEFLEMAGLAIFIYALARHIAVELGSPEIRIGPPQRPQAS
ncbi:MAG: hypothetical protein V1873_02250 [Verrucomicrobiota bacterium]